MRFRHSVKTCIAPERMANAYDGHLNILIVLHESSRRVGARWPVSSTV